MGAAILLLDALTGPWLMFPILFVLPVGLAAWFCQARCALMLAVLLPLGRLGIAVYERDGPVIYLIANALVRVAVLVLLAHFTSRTARHERELVARVQTLEGILPVCMFCKDIRDDAGNWTKMEHYIARRTEAKFSHGMCPKCAQQHYGEYLKPEGKAGG